ncbi:MAG: hypothetical protein AAGD25_34130 [Cyanobacteria bacterium P01_F01_bin.150]
MAHDTFIAIDQKKDELVNLLTYWEGLNGTCEEHNATQRVHVPNKQALDSAQSA